MHRKNRGRGGPKPFVGRQPHAVSEASKECAPKWRLAASLLAARALIAIADEGNQRQIAREVIARNLSVRETEAMVKRMGRDAPSASKATPAVTDVHTRAAEEKLRMTLGTRVRISRKGKGGRIEIDFGSEDELQRLYEHLVDARN